MEALLVADEIVAVLLVVVVGSPRGVHVSVPARASFRPPRSSCLGRLADALPPPLLADALPPLSAGGCFAAPRRWRMLCRHSCRSLCADTLPPWFAGQVDALPPPSLVTFALLTVVHLLAGSVAWRV